jgi:uncharacterized membrane protein YGL010W
LVNSRGDSGEGYPKYHQSRANLLIYIVAVPLFLLGTVTLVVAAVELSFVLLALAIGCIVVAVALQGRGHRLEAVPPEPFSGRSILCLVSSLTSGSRFRAS